MEISKGAWRFIHIFYAVWGSLLLLFVLTDLVLSFYQMGWIPAIWNNWLMLLLLLISSYLPLIYIRKISFKLFAFFILNAFLSLMLMAMMIVFPGKTSPFTESNRFGNYIRVERGFFLDGYGDYHERVNDWIMKRKIVKRVYVD